MWNFVFILSQSTGKRLNFARICFGITVPFKFYKYSSEEGIYAHSSGAFVQTSLFPDCRVS
jgi:hypothetical protein